MNERRNQDSIDQQLLQLIKQEHPESVQELVELAKAHLSINDKDARKHVVQLIDQEKITLNAMPSQTPVPCPPTHFPVTQTGFG